ncbi:carbohydrate-binding protein [Haloarcula rubripromontorii]|uniref:Carbohydrate-binding protein n=1 Tax=Haloarcula rubripromontorii TaxID=1705562 RepID=A0A847U5Z6_9EURY|nr:carbohydrate-binding protein [Haloarcula rubripromontorii]
MTNEEQNRSHDSGDVSRDNSSSAGKTVVDRRTCMKLAGVAVASLAGCAGKGDPTTGGSAATFGYGGEPAVTTQLSAVDVSQVAEDTSTARSVSSLSIDSPLSTTLSPGSADLFAFTPDSEDLAVEFTPSTDTGVAALGLFNPDGELLSQAYASSDAPVYLPESLSTSGTHYLQVMDVSRSGGDYSLTVSTDSTTQSQSPYEGSVRAIPGRIQAQNFDIGGEGEAYHDTSGGNIYGSANRDTDVDIRPTGDKSGKYNIGYFQAGEWLEYTIDATSGTYDISVRVASALSDGQLELSIGDRTITTVTVPNTGDWTSWETVTVEDIEIESDQQATLRVEALDSGVEFNWIEFEKVDTQKPYEGTQVTIPGRIEAQNFDTGGEGVSYSDTTAGNEYDTSYRDTDVDIRETQDDSGEYNIGYFEDGEWLEYSADVSPGQYDLRARVATTRDDRRLRFYLGDQELGTVDVPNTGGWTAWETATLEDVTIEADGQRVLRVEAVGSGIDFNWAEFEVAENQPFDDVPTLPGRIQAQAYDLGGEGVSYHDTTAGNEYDLGYRDSDVDIRETKDSSGTYNIGYFEDGEWLEYTVEVPAGTYDINVRVATTRDNRQLQVSLGGDKLGTVDVPNTGGWTAWETATLPDVTVQDGGTHVLQVKAVGSGIDFNWFEFSEVAETETATETETSTETETATETETSTETETATETETSTETESGTDDFGSESYGMGGYGGTQ